MDPSRPIGSPIDILPGLKAGDSNGSKHVRHDSPHCGSHFAGTCVREPWLVPV